MKNLLSFNESVENPYGLSFAITRLRSIVSKSLKSSMKIAPILFFDQDRISETLPYVVISICTVVFPEFNQHIWSTVKRDLC